MTRPALSATRSIDIINFLAAFPGRAFTLSEIARAAKINVGSCFAVLNALTAARYLVQGEKIRTYTLGPALVAVGHAALKSQALVARAQAAAEELLRDLGIPVLLSTVVGEEIVGIISLSDASGLSPGLRVGQRMPLVPPTGGPFLAWASESAIEAWIAQKPNRSEEIAAQWRHSLALTRQRGFQVTLRSAEMPELAPLLAQLASKRQVHEYKDQLLDLLRSVEQPLFQPETIQPAELYDVILIAAPIFNESGNAEFNLCLGGFRERLAGTQVEKYADQLVRACLKIMHADMALRA